MNWTKEAEDAVSRVPFFVRKRVRKRVEEEAVNQGSRRVSIEHVRTCQKRYLNNMEEEVAGFQVETCFGPSGCPNRALDDDGIAERIEELLSGKNLRGFLKEKVKGPLKIHHEFRVSISDCPNACSRPQIADIGLIGAARPELSDNPCNGCGACVEACRESSIELKDAETGPVFDYDKCLACGKCCKVCPSGTLREGQRGWRILIGGKLGRHPRLGRELEGIIPKDKALAVVEKCVDHYMAYTVEGERFGEVIDRVGIDHPSIPSLLGGEGEVKCS
jgi:anaerobic sulfite reductase subunit C